MTKNIENKITNMSDHNLLTKVATDMCWLKKIMNNHLKHHWAITLVIAAALLSTISTLIIVILK